MEEIELEEKRIVCIDCDTEFAFSIGEQAFYRAIGLIETKRCPECRAKKKEERKERKWKTKEPIMWKPQEQRET